MSSLARRIDHPVTIAEFDAHVERAGEDARLYELVGGEIVMMTNPSRRHEQIAGNIGARLKLAMDSRSCEAFQGGVRVQAAANDLGIDKTRPDIVVRCGQSTIDEARSNYLTDPVVIVEVLSPSTMDYDRGAKLEFYKSLPTLRHIVLAYQDQLRVEHYHRETDNPIWTTDVLTMPADVLHLAAVGFTLVLTDAYFGVAFA